MHKRSHDELLAIIYEEIQDCEPECRKHDADNQPWLALRAVVELHKPEDEPFQGVYNCAECTQGAFDRLTAYPCPTIQAIEKELK